VFSPLYGHHACILSTLYEQFDSCDIWNSRIITIHPPYPACAAGNAALLFLCLSQTKIWIGGKRQKRKRYSVPCNIQKQYGQEILSSLRKMGKSSLPAHFSGVKENTIPALFTKTDRGYAGNIYRAHPNYVHSIKNVEFWIAPFVFYTIDVVYRIQGFKR